MPVQGIFMILSLSYSLTLEADGLQNYVTPNETIRCSDDWTNCLILEEYASLPDAYFKNYTIFQFEPGNHRLNRSLNFTNIHNFTLQGSDSEVINILLGLLVSITWENCSNIKISSISFMLLEDFTFSIVCEHSHLVQLSGISVYSDQPPTIHT